MGIGEGTMSVFAKRLKNEQSWCEDGIMKFIARKTRANAKFRAIETTKYFAEKLSKKGLVHTQMR